MLHVAQQKDTDRHPHLNFKTIYLTTAFLWKGIIMKHIVVHKLSVVFLFVVLQWPYSGVAMTTVLCIFLSSAKQTGFVYAKRLAFQR